MRLNIKENDITFSILEGDLHEVANEDGVGYYPISWVSTTISGIAYIYPSHFLAKFVNDDEHPDGSYFSNSRDLCNSFINKIESHGSINLDKWEVLKENKTTTEERCRDEWDREMEDRSFYS